MLDHPRQRVAAQERRVAVEHEHFAVEAPERLAAQLYRVSGAALLRLEHELGAAREALLHGLGAEPHHHEAALGAERRDGLEDEPEHRPAADLVQHLRPA